MNDEKIDQIVSSSLKAEPDFFLSPDFAERVSLRISRQEQWKSDLYDYFYVLALLVSIFAFVLGLFYYIEKEVLIKFFSFVSTHSLPVLMIGFIVNFVWFTDKVLLRFLFSRWKLNN